MPIGTLGLGASQKWLRKNLAIYHLVLSICREVPALVSSPNFNMTDKGQLISEANFQVFKFYLNQKPNWNISVFLP